MKKEYKKTIVTEIYYDTKEQRLKGRFIPSSSRQIDWSDLGIEELQ